MRRDKALSALMITLFAFLLLTTIGCQSGPEEDAPKPGDAELAWLQENYPALDAKRAELNDVRARLAGDVPEEEATPDGEGGDGAEGGEGGDGEGGEAAPPMTPEELEAKATALQAEIESMTEDVGAKVVEYLNAAEISVGSEYTPEQQYAIDIKIKEDILIAQEYIRQGGDYGRALEIYSGSRQLDMDHPDLLAAIEEAETLRYMTEERFKLAKKNMTQDEIRENLGQVKHSNVRDYEDQGVQAWFYKKEDGGAAGVFFKKKGGEWKVYKLDFKAAERQVEEGE